MVVVQQMSRRSLCLVPGWQNVLEIHHKNLLEICPLGCYAKLSMEKYVVKGSVGRSFWLPRRCHAPRWSQALWPSHPCRSWVLEKPQELWDPAGGATCATGADAREAKPAPGAPGHPLEPGWTVPSSHMSFPRLLLTELSTVPPGAGDKSGFKPERQHPGSGHRPNRTGLQRTGIFAHLPLQVFVHCTFEFLFTLLGFFISSLGNLRLLEVMFS